jgi:DNA-binding ferritin-like protein
MKTIKEITEMAEKIKALTEVSEVAITEDRLIITLIDEEEETYRKIENKIKEITGDYPIACDVNIKDWFVYL